MLSWVVVGCGPPPLAHAHPSADSLARAVLDALEQRDAGTLTALRLSEAEFRTHVWPFLPAARPQRNLPFSYVWGDLAQKSEASLAGTLVAHGGRRYDLAAVRFAADPTEYGSFRVYRQSVFVVRDGSGTREIRVTGSMIEQDGRWKVFSHVVDD